MGAILSALVGRLMGTSVRPGKPMGVFMSAEDVHIHALAVWTPRRDPMDMRSCGCAPRGGHLRKAALHPRGRGRGFLDQGWT